jgi:uncharacterized protein (TIRG00374 family)
VPKATKLAIRCLITGGVLYYLFRVVPVDTILQTLKTAHPGYVLAGFALQFLTRLPIAWRIRLIATAQGMSMSVRQILSIQFAGSFYNLLLPGVIVGGAATWLKFVQSGARRGAAFTTVVVNRLSETMAVITSGAAFWIIDHADGAARWLMLPLLYIALLSGYRLVFRQAHRFAGSVASGERLRFLDSTKWSRKLKSLAGDFASTRELRFADTLALLLACLVQDVLTAGDMYMFAHSLDIPLSFVTVLWIRAAIYLAAILPLSIAGLGVREGVLVVATAAYAVAPSAAVAWGLLLFSANALGALGGGLIEARMLWARRSPASQPATPALRRPGAPD